MRIRLHAFFTRRRCLELAVAFGTLLALALTGLSSFARVCGSIRANTLRLHVLANSDSDADQAVKLQVRDALVAECARLFAGERSLAGAEADAAAALPQLQGTAEAVVRNAGYDYPVRVRLTRQYFETRTYGGCTLPAGRYHALRVELGAAAGHNWWCVLFPPLCLAAAESDGGEADLERIWGTDAARVATGDYELRFALVEWFERLKNRG